MPFGNRICQTLHEEHQSAIALVERIEALLARQRRSGPPDMADNAIVRLLSDVSASVEAEIWRHFDFEENQLFPLVNASGGEGIAALLTDEHRVIRPVGTQVAALARGAVDAGFDDTSWGEFCRLGGEFCDRMLAHVQKEEMGLLPLLEVSMDADTEARLLEEYLEVT